MQPPDTEPAILPDLVTAIWLPAGRGELPQVSVTVATATCSPAARQAAAVLSTSSTSAVLMGPSFHTSLPRPNRRPRFQDLACAAPRAMHLRRRCGLMSRAATNHK